MSYTTIVYIYPNEKIECGEELRNSWGSAPVVWDSLSQKYLGKDPHRYMSEDMKSLWNLWKNTNIPVSHRAVLMMTFDKAYVGQENYKRAIADIKQFLKDFPQPSDCVNHWPTIAHWMKMHPEIPGMGLWCTSVSENPFDGPWNEDKEEYDQPDWNDVYEIYQALDEIAK